MVRTAKGELNITRISPLIKTRSWSLRYSMWRSFSNRLHSIRKLDKIMKLLFTFLFALITVGTIPLVGGISGNENSKLDNQNDNQYSFNELLHIHNYVAGISWRSAIQKVDSTVMDIRSTRTDSTFIALKIPE